MAEESNKAKAGNSTSNDGASRTTFNYVAIAAAFMLIGIMIGSYLWNSDTDKSVLVNEAQLRSVMLSVLEESDIARASDMVLVAEDEKSDRFALVDDDPYLGEADAPVVIVEFSDFFCGYCKRHFRPDFHAIAGKLRSAYSLRLSRFCASNPGIDTGRSRRSVRVRTDKFWEFRDDFFDNQSSLNRDFYIQTAEAHGLDVVEFAACLDEGRYVGEVELDGFDGQVAGVRGTPGFFINGQILSGAQPYVIFERMIRLELEKSGIDYENASASGG